MSSSQSDLGEPHKAIVEKNNLITEYQYNNPVYETGADVPSKPHDSDVSISANGNVNSATSAAGYGSADAETPLTTPRSPAEPLPQDHYIYFPDGSPNTVTNRKDPLPILHKVQFIQKNSCSLRRICLFFLGLVLLIGIAIALYFIIDLFINKKRIPTDEKYNRIRGSVRILNMNYSTEYSNSNSGAYQYLSQDFNKELDSLFSNSSLQDTYTSCSVVGFDRGSIVTYFELVFNSKYTASDLESAAKRVFLENTVKTPSGDIYLGQYLIDSNSIQLEATYEVPEPSVAITTTSTSTTTSTFTYTVSSPSTTTTRGSTGPPTVLPGPETTPVSTAAPSPRPSTTPHTPEVTPTSSSTTSPYVTATWPTTTTTGGSTLFVPMSTTLYPEDISSSAVPSVTIPGYTTPPDETETPLVTMSTVVPSPAITPTPPHSTTSYIPVTCSPVTVPFCLNPAQVSYTYTSLPNYIGQMTQAEATDTFDSFVSLLTSGCHPNVDGFLCALLVPRCGLGGVANPPCRSFCQDFFQSCSDHLEPGIPFDINDCDAFPDVTDTDMCVLPPDVEVAPLRLLAGAGLFEGRLEVMYDGEWGSICSHGWDDSDAIVACRQLGFSDGGLARPGSYFGQYTGKIWLSEVDCYGSEDHLAMCNHAPWGLTDSCTHAQDVGITCFDPNAESLVSVRLGDGDMPSSGRVEVYYGERWGTICSTGFDNSDAAVVCGMLGYTENPGEVSVLADSPFGVGSGIMWLENLMCSGEETNIGFCEHTGWGQASCNINQVATVTCVKQVVAPPLRLVGGPDSLSGRVEVQYNNTWGTVCDELLHDGTAQVICRTMGYWGEAVILGPGTSGQGTGPIWLSGLDCVGNESSIYECNHGDWGVSNCLHSQDAAVACSYGRYDGAPTESTWVTSTSTYTLSTLAPWQRLRLTDQDAQSTGRLELLNEGTWGTVCDENFDDDDATVACRTMGYNGTGRVLVRFSDAPASTPIWITNVMCTGAESSFFNCSSDDGTTSPTCSHSNDVYIDCDTRDAALRLVGSGNPLEGRLEVFYNNQWGTICDDYFDTNAAIVACRSLGLGTSNAAFLGNTYGGGSGVIWLESLRCTGAEGYLTDCQHDMWGVHNCLHDEDVSIRCGSIPTPTYPPPTTGVPSCEPIMTPVCVDNMPYQLTRMPNLLGHVTQEEAEEAFLTNNWHHPLTLCPQDMLYFTCSLLYPECTANITTLNPCQSVCERAKASCMSIMEAEGYEWPDAFDCSMLPSQPEDCFDPEDLVTVPPEQGECEVISIPMCSLDTNYNFTQMPNLLGQSSQSDAIYSSFTWTYPVSTACHPLIRPFLCSMYAPQCVPGFEEVPPLKPCRHLCYEIKTSCEVDLMGQPWPADFNCDSFIDDPSGEHCLLFEAPGATTLSTRSTTSRGTTPTPTTGNATTTSPEISTTDLYATPTAGPVRTTANATTTTSPEISTTDLYATPTAGPVRTTANATTTTPEISTTDLYATPTAGPVRTTANATTTTSPEISTTDLYATPTAGPVRTTANATTTTPEISTTDLYATPTASPVRTTANATTKTSPEVSTTDLYATPTAGPVRTTANVTTTTSPEVSTTDLYATPTAGPVRTTANMTTTSPEISITDYYATPTAGPVRTTSNVTTTVTPRVTTTDFYATPTAPPVTTTPMPNETTTMTHNVSTTSYGTPTAHPPTTRPTPIGTPTTTPSTTSQLTTQAHTVISSANTTTTAPALSTLPSNMSTSRVTSAANMTTTVTVSISPTLNETATTHVALTSPSNETTSTTPLVQNETTTTQPTVQPAVNRTTEVSSPPSNETTTESGTSAPSNMTTSMTTSATTAISPSTTSTTTTGTGVPVVSSSTAKTTRDTGPPIVSTSSTTATTTRDTGPPIVGSSSTTSATTTTRTTSDTGPPIGGLSTTTTTTTRGTTRDTGPPMISSSTTTTTTRGTTRDTGPPIVGSSTTTTTTTRGTTRDTGPPIDGSSSTTTATTSTTKGTTRETGPPILASSTTTTTKDTTPPTVGSSTTTPRFITPTAAPSTSSSSTTSIDQFITETVSQASSTTTTMPPPSTTRPAWWPTTPSTTSSSSTTTSASTTRPAWWPTTPTTTSSPTTTTTTSMTTTTPEAASTITTSTPHPPLLSSTTSATTTTPQPQPPSTTSATTTTTPQPPPPSTTSTTTTTTPQPPPPSTTSATTTTTPQPPPPSTTSATTTTTPQPPPPSTTSATTTTTPQPPPPSTASTTTSTTPQPPPPSSTASATTSTTSTSSTTTSAASTTTSTRITSSTTTTTTTTTSSEASTTSLPTNTTVQETTSSGQQITNATSTTSPPTSQTTASTTSTITTTTDVSSTTTSSLVVETTEHEDETTSEDVNTTTTSTATTTPAAQCELILHDDCTPSQLPGFYNSTILPNTFGWSTQADVMNNSAQYVALSDVPCSNYQLQFVCAALYPKCDVIDGAVTQVMLCRSLCLKVKDDCLPLLNQFGVDWPDEVSCDLFPEEEPCYNPMSDTL